MEQSKDTIKVEIDGHSERFIKGVEEMLKAKIDEVGSDLEKMLQVRIEKLREKDDKFEAQINELKKTIEGINESLKKLNTSLDAIKSETEEIRNWTKLKLSKKLKGGNSK